MDTNIIHTVSSIIDKLSKSNKRKRIAIEQNEIKQLKTNFCNLQKIIINMRKNNMNDEIRRAEQCMIKDIFKYQKVNNKNDIKDTAIILANMHKV